VVVLGARDYYSRFGFMRARDYGLANEYGADEEFMALELVEGALSGRSGVIKYAAEFTQTGC
jgi:putative acetyltransferase